MKNVSMKKVLLITVALAGCFMLPEVFAATGKDAVVNATNVSGAGMVAKNVTTNLANFAYLITAGAYVAGMAFVVGAIVKFKAHKDNPTQIPIGTPIALLFVGAALIFVPSVFSVGGATLFGKDAYVAGVSGITDFGASKAKKERITWIMHVLKQLFFKY